MKLSEAELTELKKELKGCGGLIAERSDSTRQAVHQVLNGVYYNEDIIKNAIKLRNQLRRKKDSIVNKLKS